MIEVKGCWNPKLSKSLGEQLVQRYLVPNRWTYGVYLIGWFPNAGTVKWDGRRSTVDLADATVIAEKWACEQSTPEVTVKALLLDCGLR